MVQRTEEMREAKAELMTARDLRACGLWSRRCFNCRQAAGKALKAVGGYFRQNSVGQNLGLLIRDLRAFVATPESFHQACIRLNRYHIPALYPTAFDRGAPVDQFFEQGAREAVQDADLVLELARSVIAAPRV